MKNEIDIDFIKWMCDKAEGFEWVIGSGIEGLQVFKTLAFFPEDQILKRFNYFSDALFEKVYYPLIIQRATRKVISENKWNWTLFNIQPIIDALLNDEKAEEWLRYIYKEEKKNV